MASWSDDFGRKPVLAYSLVLNSFAADVLLLLATFPQFSLWLLVAALGIVGMIDLSLRITEVGEQNRFAEERENSKQDKTASPKYERS